MNLTMALKFGLFCNIILVCGSLNIFASSTIFQNIKKVQYVEIEKYFPKGYVKDGSVDYTTVLQELIDKYDSILMPDFALLVNEKGIRIGSNKNILFAPKTILIMKPNASTNYSILHIENANNINIVGAKLEGDRDFHQSSAGEWGMGIYLKGAHNVILSNIEIIKCWGDGIYIDNSQNRITENISILNSHFSWNRRNGISIIGGLNIMVKNCSFSHINGTNPKAGIDIEPNNDKGSLNNIHLYNIKTKNCRVGIQIGLMRYPDETEKEVNITINNLTSVDDDFGLLLGDYFRKKQYEKREVKKLKGIINISNITIVNAKNEPIKIYNFYGYSPEQHISNIKIFNEGKELSLPSLAKRLRAQGFLVK